VDPPSLGELFFARSPTTSLDASLGSMKTISYVLYREDQFIVEQCLNVEVSSFGATRDEAVVNLKEAVELYFEGESGNTYTPVSEIAIGQEMVDA
jgi:predicted RNase H-like HicB family nuclease